jgi:hypothetical protein
MAGIHRDTDLISLLLFFQNKESRLIKWFLKWYSYVGLDLLTAVTMKITALWGVTQYNLVHNILEETAASVSNVEEWPLNMKAADSSETLVST